MDNWTDSGVFSRLAKTLLARLTSALGVIVLSVLLARMLSLEEAGEFFGAFTICMGLSIVLRWGQDIMVLREIANAAETQQHTAVWHAIFLVGGLSVFVTAALLITATLTDSNATLLYRAAAPLLPLALMNVFSAILKGNNKPALGGLFEVGLVSGAASILIFLSSASTASAAWDCLVISAWVLSASIASYTVWIHDIRWTRPTNLIHRVRQSFDLWLVAVLSYLSQWGGVIFMAAVANIAEIAIVNALFRLLAPIQFVILTLDAFFAPRFARENVSNCTVAHRQSVYFGLLVVSPYAFIILTRPELLLVTIYGQSYGGHGLALQLLAIASVVQISMGPNGMLLMMRQAERTVLLSVVLRATTSLFCFALLYSWSPIFAAVISFSAGVFLQSLFNRRAAIRLLRHQDSFGKKQ